MLWYINIPFNLPFRNFFQETGHIVVMFHVIWLLNSHASLICRGRVVSILGLEKKLFAPAQNQDLKASPAPIRPLIRH